MTPQGQEGHTPTPWEWWKMNDGGYGIGRVLRPSNSCDIASKAIDSKADAVFICEAVNNYEAERQARKEAEEKLAKAFYEWNETDEKLSIAREALEKIRSTNGLQYSDFFKICDEALEKLK